jgi:hypothetical protein
MDKFRNTIGKVVSLNKSRTLTCVVDKSTTELLTPNHFLIGNLYRAISTIDLDPQDDIQVRDVVIQLDPKTS